VIEISIDGTIAIRQPTTFLDFSLAPKGTSLPDIPNLPPREQIEATLYQQALVPLLGEERKQREKDIRTISEHMEISLNAIIDRAQIQFAELHRQKEVGSQEQGLDGRIKMLEDKLDELNQRLEKRRAELAKEHECTVDNIRHLGSAWVLPHPERQTPTGRKMVTDPAIERMAVEAAIRYEEVRGWKVESVEDDDRGFDLISRRPHPDDAQTAIEVRFIEVKGRANIGEVALSTNEFKTAQRLKNDYWLYTVFNCSTEPAIHTIQDPARLGWKSIVQVDHYYVSAHEIMEAESRHG
jgi:hypothetical protein